MQYCSNGNTRFKLVTADLKLVSQEGRFPAHFQGQEEGFRQVAAQTNVEVAGREVEEIPVKGTKSRTMRVNKQLPSKIKRKLTELFDKYEDVFAWDHTELKGIDPWVCQYQIPLKADARPVRMQRYKMNPNYAKKVKEELDALLGS